MAIIINRNGETIFGQYAKGDVVLNLSPSQENLLLEAGQAQRLDDSDVLVVLASGVLIAPGDVAAAGLPAGALLKDPVTGLLYGQSDGAGGYEELGGGGSGPVIAAGHFNGAGTFIILRGPGTVLGVVLTTSVVGTVKVMDGLIEAEAVELLASTATAAGNNVYIPVGTPGVGVAANTAILLIVTGANVGQVVFSEEP